MSSKLPRHLAPTLRIALLLDRFAASTHPTGHLDLRNRVRFAFNLTNLLDDTGRSAVDERVEKIVRYCLVLDTGIDCTRIANELYHYNRRKDDDVLKSIAGVSSTSDDDLTADSKQVRLSFCRSAKSAELLCKCVGEVLKRDTAIASQIGASRLLTRNGENETRGDNNSRISSTDSTAAGYENDDDDAAVSAFLHDAATQQRQARVHEIQRCWFALLGVLAVSLRWAASRPASPNAAKMASSEASLALLLQTTSGAGSKIKDKNQRRLVLEAINSVSWSQMHVVGFVVTSALATLNTAQESLVRNNANNGSGLLRVAARGGSAKHRGRGGEMMLIVDRTSAMASVDGRRFVVYALNRCDAVINEIQQNRRQLVRRDGASSSSNDKNKNKNSAGIAQDDDEEASASKHARYLVAQLPGTLRILTSLKSIAAKQQAFKLKKRRRVEYLSRGDEKDSSNSCSNNKSNESESSAQAQEEEVDAESAKILAGVDACVQNILSELHLAFMSLPSSLSSSLHAASTGGKRGNINNNNKKNNNNNNDDDNDQSDSGLMPRRQLMQIFASLGFLHAFSFNALCAVAAPLKVCSLDKIGAPVHQQAALVSFVMSSLQQQEKKGSSHAPAPPPSTLLRREADDLVCRRIRAIVKVLKEEDGIHSSNNGVSHSSSSSSSSSRRVARRYEQAVTLLKLICRCPVVFLPRAAAVLCDELIEPLMLSRLFGALVATDSSSSGAAMKSSTWLDLRDILLALTTIRRQLRRNSNKSSNAAVADDDIIRKLEVSLSNVESRISRDWNGLAERAVSVSRATQRHYFEHTQADFHLAREMLPVVAAWAAQTGNGEILKSTLRAMIGIAFLPVSRLQLRREGDDGQYRSVSAHQNERDELDGDDDGDYSGGDAAGVRHIDRGAKHVAWLTAMRRCVDSVSAQLDDSRQNPEDVDDALAALRAWSRRTVQKMALFARLGAQDLACGEGELPLNDWYAAFWLKTYPVLVSSTSSSSSSSSQEVLRAQTPQHQSQTGKRDDADVRTMQPHTNSDNKEVPDELLNTF